MSRKRGSILPIIIMAFGALLIFAAVAWYLSVLNANNQAEQTSLVEQTNSDVERVSLAQAKDAYDRGIAVFVDVRDSDSYIAGHIPGALSIPLEELPDQISQLDPEAWIITY